MNELVQKELQVGLARLQEFWLNQAEESFQRVLAAAPNHAAALHLMGITAFRLNRHDEGIALLRRAVALEPARVSARLDIAVALRDVGRIDEAESSFCDAIASVPASVRPSSASALKDQVFSIERRRHTFKLVDYEYGVRIRYGAGLPPHLDLANLIGAGRRRYANFIEDIGRWSPDFQAVALKGSYAGSEPFWINTWFPPLDAMALHAVLCRYKPRRFVEIGSGMSTKFARAAISRQGLDVQIISVDPQPRNAIDNLTDRNIRAPLESIDLSMFDELVENDVFFLDSSHRSFQNSDVTVFFLDVLPRLRPGVLVHLHDIYLPFDYPAGHIGRMWNEQYLLATAFLYGGANLEIMFPCWYVTQDVDLSARVNELMRTGTLTNLSIHGASFWIRKT
jgi:tetratricopeptide (TPR) repeat protein